jgi:hypothetical protein
VTAAAAVFTALVVAEMEVALALAPGCAAGGGDK